MDKYAVIVTNYPSQEDPAPVGFVHSRVRAYIKEGIDVTVLCLSQKNGQYIYDDVPVVLGNISHLRDNIRTQKYKKILVHFLLKEIDPIIFDQNAIIWVHGFESLSWKRRLFNINWKFSSYIVKNQKQLSYFRNYVNSHPNSRFVFVSEWMKRIAETDCKVKFREYNIIPNFINEEEFPYFERTSKQVNNVLIIRSFASRKYANDISMNVINRLSRRKYFKDMIFDIYGTGKYFKKLTMRVSHFDNVHIYEKSLNHAEIYDLHKSHGSFLCPTRQDAQGVSMCEAMSSGCVPITSNNTAIPEYLSRREGFLCDNRDTASFVRAFDALQDEELFHQMSKNAHIRVCAQCSYEKTIKKEIELIKG